MKKQHFFLFILSFNLMAITSCESADDVKADIDVLRTERTSLQNDVNQLKIHNEAQVAENSELESKAKLLKIYASGKEPKFILKLHLKQSHLSLDPMKHIKDGMNAIDFEIPVSKEFYNSVHEGQEIVDKFRAGSFVLYGSFGDWKMKVKSKEIRE